MTQHTNSPDHLAGYWKKVGEQSLTCMACKQCAHHFLPSLDACPQCLSFDVHLVDASGRARLLSWVTFHHAYRPELVSRVPYIVALVELEEGPRMITNLPMPSTGLVAGMELTVRFVPHGDELIPNFEPQIAELENGLNT